MWQMDKDLGADEDDGTFMEASPTQDSQAEEEEEVVSFPVGKTAATGLHTEPESIPEREALRHHHYHKFMSKGSNQGRSGGVCLIIHVGIVSVVTKVCTLNQMISPNLILWL